jgi:hypothetical protein
MGMMEQALQIDKASPMDVASAELVAERVGERQHDEEVPDNAEERNEQEPDHSRLHGAGLRGTLFECTRERETVKDGDDYEDCQKYEANSAGDQTNHGFCWIVHLLPPKLN